MADRDKASRADTQPWDQRERETPPAFEAFALYRDLGSQRSIRKVAQRLGKRRSLLERWSRQHSWVERALAYDAEADRKWRTEREAYVQQARTLSDRVGLAIDHALLQRLQGDQNTTVEQIHPGQLEWPDVARLRRANTPAAPRPDAGRSDLVPAESAAAEISALIVLASQHMTDEAFDRFLAAYRELQRNPDDTPMASDRH